MAMVLRFIIQWFLQRFMVRTLQTQTHLFALKALEATRKSLWGIVLGLVFLQVVTLSLIGALVTGVYLLPLDFEQKVFVLFCSFLGIILIGAIALLIALSGRVWLRAAQQYRNR